MDRAELAGAVREGCRRRRAREDSSGRRILAQGGRKTLTLRNRSHERKDNPYKGCAGRGKEILAFKRPGKESRGKER